MKPMAARTIVTLIDDLDGSDADETVRLSLDGQLYELDLTAEHARQLRTGLADWVDAARQISRMGLASASRSATAGTAPDAIRRWAHEHGVPCPNRGRIPNAVREAFLHGSASTR